MSTFSRRSFALSLAGAAALPSLAGFGRGALAKSPGALSFAPSIARFKIGAVEIAAISDGFIDLPFGGFTGAPAAEVEAAFTARSAVRPTGARLGFTVWLVNDGERLTLIDSGAAGMTGPTSGRLPSALQALGVKPADIDAVLITHMHVDHIGGLVAGGRAAFPDAELIIQRRDVEHFSDPARAAAASDVLKSSFDAAARVIALYPKLQRIDGERSLTRVLSTIDLSGHTPGHMGVRVADGGQSLLIVGDMLFDPALHPGRTDVGIVFEADPAAAAAMRTRFFPRAVEEKALLAATHMPFPGLGRIVTEGGVRRWTPADWEYLG